MKFLCIAVGIHAKATVILTLHFLSFYCFFFYKIRTLHPEKTTVIVNFLIIPLCFYICLPVLAHICSKIILCICVFQFSTHPTPCRFHTVILCFFLKFYLHLFRCRRFIRCKLHLSGQHCPEWNSRYQYRTECKIRSSSEAIQHGTFHEI